MPDGLSQKDGPAKSASVVRCAIYTRKSTEEGLDQDFNSLQAQREAAEAYIHIPGKHWSRIRPFRAYSRALA